MAGCVFAVLAARSLWAAVAPSEFDLKAVFLYHFTQFVEWPETAFSSADAPFVICVIGEDPFGTALQNIIRGEFVGHHPLVLRKAAGLTDTRGCQILYVPKSSESRVNLGQLEGGPILTVGESAAFYHGGGMIQFFTDRRHLRLRVNLAVARSHALVISAKLLRVADVTSGDGTELAPFQRYLFALKEPGPTLKEPGDLSLTALSRLY